MRCLVIPDDEGIVTRLSEGLCDMEDSVFVELDPTGRAGASGGGMLATVSRALALAGKKLSSFDAVVYGKACGGFGGKLQSVQSPADAKEYFEAVMSDIQALREFVSAMVESQRRNGSRTGGPYVWIVVPDNAERNPAAASVLGLVKNLIFEDLLAPIGQSSSRIRSAELRDITKQSLDRLASEMRNPRTDTAEMFISGGVAYRSEIGFAQWKWRDMLVPSTSEGPPSSSFSRRSVSIDMFTHSVMQLEDDRSVVSGGQSSTVGECTVGEDVVVCFGSASGLPRASLPANLVPEGATLLAMVVAQEALELIMAPSLGSSNFHICVVMASSDSLGFLPALRWAAAAVPVDLDVLLVGTAYHLPEGTVPRVGAVGRSGAESSVRGRCAGAIVAAPLADLQASRRRLGPLLSATDVVLSLSGVDGWASTLDAGIGKCSQALDVRSVLQELSLRRGVKKLNCRLGGTDPATSEAVEWAAGPPALPRQPATAELHRRSCLVQRHGAYLFTGALRVEGLGFLMAEWFGKSGAGMLVLTGRSMPAGEKAEIFNKAVTDPNRMGDAKVVLLKADVCESAGVLYLLEETKKLELPLVGIIHGAADFKDGMFRDIAKSNAETFDAVMKPKVLGTVNLHWLALQHPQLQLFLMQSSIASSIGNLGQASYGAANAFQDGFAKYLRSHGRPGNAINWTALSGVGVMHGKEKLEDQLSTTRGFESIDKATIFKAFEAVLALNRPQILVAKFDMVKVQGTTVAKNEFIRGRFHSFMQRYGFEMGPGSNQVREMSSGARSSEPQPMNPRQHPPPPRSSTENAPSSKAPSLGSSTETAPSSEAPPGAVASAATGKAALIKDILRTSMDLEERNWEDNLSLLAMGLDSGMAIEVRQQLMERVQIDQKIAKIELLQNEHKTAAEIIAELCQSLDVD